MYGNVFETNEAVGVIGVACPDSQPLLAFVSLFAAAISRGNTVVMIPSEKYPLAAVQLYHVCVLSSCLAPFPVVVLCSEEQGKGWEVVGRGGGGLNVCEKERARAQGRADLALVNARG